MTGGPLAGVTVLDLSRVLAGPWAGQLLADYGATVIKIERPGCGDDTRAWGPPWVRDDAAAGGPESAYYHAANRNKQSVTVNIATPDGQALVRRLAARSDVLIENYRVGALARYGLDAATLRSAQPELIYCSISAYGQDSPRAAEPGYDAMIQASAGLMSLTGEADGMPQKTGVAVADIMAGMYATTAILAALHRRGQTGDGESIDVPLFDSQVAWLANQAMNYLVSGDVPQRHGNGHPNIVPYQSFETADGYLMLAVGNDRQFAACCDALGVAGLAGDERFASNSLRVANRSECVAALAAVLQRGTTAHWLGTLGKRGVPCGPINDLQQVFSDPHTIARGLRIALPHADGGTVPGVSNPVRFATSPAARRQAAPRLGQHTDEVLRDLAYTDDEIARLRAAGTI